MRFVRLLSLLVSGLLVLPGCPNDPTVNNDLGWIARTVGAGEVVVDATAKEGWTYLSLEKGVLAEAPADPSQSMGWDLAFRRYNIRTNGGSSGPGQGAAADLGDRDLEKTDHAEVPGWTADVAQKDARTGEQLSMNAVLSGWYSYHFFKHQLVSNYRLYAVRAADGRVGLLKIHQYYDEVGTAGKITLIYRFPVKATDIGGSVGSGTGTDTGTATVQEPEAEVGPISEFGVVRGESNLDARAGKTWVRFGAAGITATTNDPGPDGAWDLAVDQWLLQTNSGTSGKGKGGAQLAGEVVARASGSGCVVPSAEDFAKPVSAPASGWKVDDIEEIGAERRKASTNPALAGWFDYDPTTQKICSLGHVVWLTTHDGRFAKIQLVGYYHPDGSEVFYRLRWAVRPDGGRNFGGE